MTAAPTRAAQAQRSQSTRRNEERTIATGWSGDGKTSRVELPWQGNLANWWTTSTFKAPGKPVEVSVCNLGPGCPNQVSVPVPLGGSVLLGRRRRDGRSETVRLVASQEGKVASETLVLAAKAERKMELGGITVQLNSKAPSRGSVSGVVLVDNPLADNRPFRYPFSTKVGQSATVELDLLLEGTSVKVQTSPEGIASVNLIKKI